MHTGILNLFCPICGAVFRWDQNKPSPCWHHKEFGVLCSKNCHEAAELKYAKMILGKDE